MKKASGFTLIELVVVIVILGVLAVTAAPRFLNLQTDAKNSALLGLKGALESAMAVSYGKLAIDGLENDGNVFFFPGVREAGWCERCYFMYGYPGNSSMTFPYLLSEITATPNEDSDWFVGAGGAKPDQIIFSFPERFEGTVLNSDNCYLQYTASKLDTETQQVTPYTLEVIPCE